MVPPFTVACMRREPPVIHGDGEQTRDFTYIDDVVDTNIRASRTPEHSYGLAFNIGGGAEPTSMNRLFRRTVRAFRDETGPG